MRPGRPRCPRRVQSEPAVSYFKPQGVPLKELEVIRLSLEELEAVRLSDLEGMNQEDAAQRIGISRRALWEDLQNARRKIVDALVSGKAIEIKGGNYALESRWRCICHECESEWEVPVGNDDQIRCPSCGSEEIRREIREHGSMKCGFAHRGRRHNHEERMTRSAEDNEV